MRWLAPSAAAISQSQPNFGIETFATLSSRRNWCAGGGHVNGRVAVSFAPRSLDIYPCKPAPSWVVSQTRHRSATTMSVAAGLVGDAVEIAASVTNNIGLLLIVRGGGGEGGVVGGIVAGFSPVGGVLLTTACLSAVLERRTRAGAVVGAPLLSFGTFCILSNLGLVPSTHPLYDLCWSFLLPLSLSIIIMSNSVITSTNDDDNIHHQWSSDDSSSDLLAAAKKQAAGGPRRYVAGPMSRVGLSFFVGAVGSVVGVAAAFFVVTSCDVGGGGGFGLPRETAAQIAGAVAATYIGGSVNLFAVAAAVGLMGAVGGGGASLLGALAASDIFIMALYFSGLVAASKTPFFRRVFPSSAESRSRPNDLLSAKKENKDSEMATIKTAVVVVDRVETVPPARAIRTTKEPRRSSSLMSPSAAAVLSTTTTTTLALVALGSAICFSGNAVASRSPLPGTSTMAITLLTFGVTRLLSRYVPTLQTGFSRAGPLVAAVLLNAFFGSVGASGRLAEVVGVAPAIFVFASVALAVHIAVMATGVATLNRCCATGLGIDDMIVASNANIGGPSTAATFAGLIGRDELVVPAAVWGTVGYAVATTLGVGIWTVLR